MVENITNGMAKVQAIFRLSEMVLNFTAGDWSKCLIKNV